MIHVLPSPSILVYDPNANHQKRASFDPYVARNCVSPQDLLQSNSHKYHHSPTKVVRQAMRYQDVLPVIQHRLLVFPDGQ